MVFNHCTAFHCIDILFPVAPDCWAIIVSYFSLLQSVLEWTLHIFEKEEVDGKQKKANVRCDWIIM